MRSLVRIVATTASIGVVVIACATSSHSQRRGDTGESQTTSASSSESTVDTSEADERATAPSDTAESGLMRTVETAFQSFVQTPIASETPLMAAVTAHLSPFASSEEGMTIERWSGRRLGESRFRFELRWAEGRPSDGETHAMTSSVFEYDLDRRSVAARSESAQAIVGTGRTLDADPPLEVLPNSFHPEAKSREGLWSGTAAKACQTPSFAPNCRAMEAFFANHSLIDALRWMLTSTLEADDRVTYRALKDDGDCSWNVVAPLPDRLKVSDWSYRRIAYECPEGTLKWNVDEETNRIEGVEGRTRLVTALGRLEGEPRRVSGSWQSLRRSFVSASDAKANSDESNE